jgi:small subunit ribosomal protein S20
MAHSLSAKKRVRQTAKHNIINRARKSVVKTQVKVLEAALTGGDKKAAAAQYKLIIKSLDKVAAKGTIHKKKAARLKSRMARKINKLKG